MSRAVVTHRPPRYGSDSASPPCSFRSAISPYSLYPLALPQELLKPRMHLSARNFRWPALLVACEPLVARLTADLEPLADDGKRLVGLTQRGDETHSLVHGAGLPPGHRGTHLAPIAPRHDRACHPGSRSKVLPVYPVCTPHRHQPEPPGDHRTKVVLGWASNEPQSGASSLIAVTIAA